MVSISFPYFLFGFRLPLNHSEACSALIISQFQKHVLLPQTNIGLLCKLIFW